MTIQKLAKHFSSRFSGKRSGPGCRRQRRRRLHEALQSLEPRRVLASIVVTTADDVVDTTDGVISLREAITTANNDAGEDTITFDPGVFDGAGTNSLIRLTAGSELQITETLTINASTATEVVISGDVGSNDSLVFGTFVTDVTASEDDGTLDDNVRVLNFFAASGDLTLRGLTITGGRATDSSPVRNDGAGILFNGSGTLTLEQSAISGNSGVSSGGGIFNVGGTVNVTSSTISGNSASSGGGIFNVGTVNVTSGTISGNSASGGNGGGIFNFGTMNVTSSTISGNSANSGGGIYNDSDTVNITSSIVAGNSATNGANTDGDFTDNGFNLIGGEPRLGPLADNGGPTQTHALLPGSPAINAGDPNFATPPPFDQRGTGFDRVELGRVDIGAVELQATAPSQPLVVSTTEDVVDGDFTEDQLSIREAILIAGDVPGADTITFASPLFGSEQTILLDSQLPTITDNLTITGPGAGLLTLDAGLGGDGLGNGNGFRIFNINDNSADVIDVEISGLTLRGGDSLGAGGAIRNTENLTVTQAAVIDNSAQIDGGGIFNINGTVNLISSTISGNSAAFDGGGLAMFNGTFNVTNSTISGNTAGDEGGGVANNAGTLEILSSTITGNSSVNSGGGVYLNPNNPTTTTINNSILAANLGGGDIGTSNAMVNLTGDNNIVADGSGTGLTDTIAEDPMLGPLADNGGPTQTHALPFNSPAIDAGDNTLLPVGVTTDQRGLARMAGNQLDIGAFELQVIPTQGLMVSTTTDVVDGNFTEGELSLREAILIAGDVAGADTITFDANLFTTPQRINLVSQLPTITQSLTITGPGLDPLTIDAGGSSRIFLIDDNVTGVNLSGLTLTGGTTANITSGSDSGGAIRVEAGGELNLSDSLLIGNESIDDGGAISFASGSTGVIERSTFTNNRAVEALGVDLENNSGGAIINGGNLTIRNSTFINNRAEFGGAILTTGASSLLTIDGSTFSGNRAAEDGGAIRPSTDSTTTINNSTITGNRVDEDADNGLGGGIALTSTATVTIHNTIVSGNEVENAQDSSADNISQGGGTLSGGFNLLGDGDTTGPNDIIGENVPGLGPLGDNGGPTLTHALLPDSPALNAGDSDLLPQDVTSDQRGLQRVAGGQVDIGAFELQVMPDQGLIVSNIDDVVDGDFTEGQLSLREAIVIASDLDGDNTIIFDAGLSGAEIDLVLGELVINETLTIDASDLSDPITIDAQQNSRVLNFSAATGDLTLQGLIITGGQTTGNFVNGGGIRFRSDGVFTLISSTVSGNRTTGGNGRGGGIYTYSGSVSLTGSTLSGNSTTGSSADGGGIFTGSGSVTLTSSTVSGNSTTGSSADGGGIYTYSGSVSLISSTVSGNSSGDDGGGISTRSGSVILTSSTLNGNEAVGEGGGFFMFNLTANPPLQIENSIIADNLQMVTAPGVGAPNDPVPDPDSMLTINHSLIGVADNLIQAITGDVGNLTGIGTMPLDPRLGPLSDNGGPTQTHALLPGSPAINAGDPNFDDSTFNPPILFDQRGDGFDRVGGGRIDISAFESTSIELVANDDMVVVMQGSSVTFNPLANDDLSAADTVLLNFFTAQLDGSIFVDADNTITFTPNDGAIGTTSFDYFFEDNLGNQSNIATVTIVIEAPLDFGDAPTGFPVTLADDGARHAISGLFLGAGVDAEPDGVPSDDAGSDGNDDDGVFVIAEPVAVADQDTTASFQIVASGAGFVSAWIDFNGDGDWDDPGEQIATDLAVVSGSNILSYTVPAGATPGQAAARFRLSTQAGLSPTGAAPDGEVEDYIANILDGSPTTSVLIDLVDPAATIVIENGQRIIRSGSDDLFATPIADVGSLDIFAGAGGTVLTLDQSGGEVVPTAGLIFAGDAGPHQLRVIGGDLDLTAPGIILQNVDVIELDQPALPQQLVLDANALAALAGGSVFV